MHQLIAKLNLQDLTIAYGMSMCFHFSTCVFAPDSQGGYFKLCPSFVLICSRDKVSCPANPYFGGAKIWTTAFSPVSFQTTPDDPLEMRIETVGRVQPHVRAKIIDEHGKVTPIGKRPIWLVLTVQRSGADAYFDRNQ